MNNNQTENIKDELKRIAAKQTLGLPLSDRDNAILTLYGQPETDADAANATDDQTPKDIAIDVCCALIAPLVDIFAPVIDAVVDVVLMKIKDGGGTFHPTQKPLSVLIDLINAFTKAGDIILDPFAGSLTTAVEIGRAHV